MASFTLLVTSAPYSSQRAYSAYRFAMAALESEHRITGIFFYQAGVLNGNKLQQCPSDEFNLLEAWEDLANKQNVTLMACVSAATKRGITTEQDAIDVDQTSFSLSNSFESVGIGELAVLTANSDKMVQF